MGKMGGEERTVCVTGDWRLLGYWVVKLLLSKGYSVVSSIPFTPDEASELVAFSCMKGGQLQVVGSVDPLDFRSLCKLFNGCIGVFHIPSPNYYLNGTQDYPADAVEFEVRSILNVVEVCAYLQSVSRLVLTSCMSTLLWDSDHVSANAVVDERCWSNAEYCKKQKLWAALSKTRAERAAWALARDRDLDLVVINPATVLGPRPLLPAIAKATQHTVELSRALNESGIYAFIHVDDLAAAHVAAFEAEQAWGRYACFERVLSKENIIEAAQLIYPNHPISKRLEAFKPSSMSNEKILELGVVLGSPQ